MAKPPKDVTDAELAVLRALWERGTATIRKLTDELYPAGGPAHYATVQKLLERLEAKGFVARARDRVPHVYEASVRRDELITHRLDALANKLCEGSIGPLLTNLVQGRRLSPAERKALRELVDGLDQGDRDGGPP